MRTAFIVAVAILLFSCNQQQEVKQLQLRVDSLEKKLNEAYKPGLGEFMADIQLHHAKLYFAGKHAKWKLADFEIKEIMEALDDVKDFAADRPESKLVPVMLGPALDSLNDAIVKKDTAQFNRRFVVLTNTCNNCHAAVHFEFNIITLPTIPPYSNQEF